MKDHHVDPKETGAHNPFFYLMCKLAGKVADRPRRKTPVNVWRKTERVSIDNEIKQNHSDVPKAQLAALRDKIARDRFAKLPLETRRHWELLAEQEHDVALEQWEKDVAAAFSTDPADRQRYVIFEIDKGINTYLNML